MSNCYRTQTDTAVQHFLSRKMSFFKKKKKQKTDKPSLQYSSSSSAQICLGPGSRFRGSLHACESRERPSLVCRGSSSSIVLCFLAGFFKCHVGLPPSVHRCCVLSRKGQQSLWSTTVWLDQWGCCLWSGDGCRWGISSVPGKETRCCYSSVCPLAASFWPERKTEV